MVVGVVAVVVGAIVDVTTVVVGAPVVATVMAVVVGAVEVSAGAVEIGAWLAAVATVVAGVAVSELPPHPEATNKNASATAHFLTVPVCHPTPEGAVGVSAALGRETIDKLPAAPDPPNGGLAASERGGCGLPRCRYAQKRLLL